MRLPAPILVLLTLTLPGSSFGEKWTPECSSWRSQVFEVMAQEESLRNHSLVLKPGHTVKEAIRLISEFPALKSAPLERIKVTATKSEIKMIVKQVTDRPSCPTLLYYDLTQFTLKSSKPSPSEKKRLVQVMLKLIIRNEDSDASLVEFLLHLNLLKIANEEKLIHLSDPLYLKLGDLFTQGRHLGERVQKENTDTDWECFDHKDCDLKTYRDAYESLRFESVEARLLASELAWIARRLELPQPHSLK
jgi:hypothetical protein